MCYPLNSESQVMSIPEHLHELNQLHKSLRTALTTGDDEGQAIHWFIALHSQLHSRRISPNTPWSYEDLLLEGLEEVEFRRIPAGQEHSLAWIVWHLSRIEDVTMNILVAGRHQVFEMGGWQGKTRSPIKHTGNGTSLDVVEALSAVVDINALRAYRVAVGLATQEIVRSLTLSDFKRKVSPGNIQRILREGAVIAAGKDVVDYWSRRDVAGLLLMPPTRHTIVHWNEARKILDVLKAKST
jgi:hypothetical protein